ncbi:hypothetical protein AVEN_140927-1, partial [Araneus ventricosus]
MKLRTFFCCFCGSDDSETSPPSGEAEHGQSDDWNNQTFYTADSITSSNTGKGAA